MNVTHIPENQRHLWRDGLRADIHALGLRSGQEYPYQGETWLIYDFDADRDAPGGATLCLVAPDFARTARGVRHVARASDAAHDAIEAATTVPRGMIDMLVGALHVGESDAAVRAYLDAKLRPDVPAKLRRACLAYAVRAHRRNQRLYQAVMSGRMR